MRKTMSLETNKHKKKKKKPMHVESSHDSIYDLVKKAFYESRNNPSGRVYTLEDEDDDEMDEEWY